MVEALVQGLKGGGDNGGYILEMCSGHPLVASYFGPNFFFIIWRFRKLGNIFSF